MLPRDYLEAFLARLGTAPVAAIKQSLASQYGLLPSNTELLMSLDEEGFARAKPFLMTKPARSQSGVTVIAIMARPSNCPHGRCTYCPGGLRSAFGDVPQSYTGNEPASMRGRRAGWDAYVQVFNRLEQYVVTGHAPQKIELIIMGGTFPNEEPAYQDAFVTDAFRALNDFSREFYADGELLLERFKEFFELPGAVGDAARTARIQARIRALKTRRPRTLAAAQAENENAQIRCVGLTIETRPSKNILTEGLRMLAQGCTRVELGIQTTFDDVLTAVHRGHSVQDSIETIAVLRDLGFKLNFHIMLGLPLMTRERDLAAARRLFTDEAFMPDMIKLYPCLVLPGTPLYNDWKVGRYTPLTTDEAAALIAEILRFVPPWCRVMRVQRDIPTKVTAAGPDRTNLRQYVDEVMAAQGWESKEIRAREARESRSAPRLRREHYRAAGGDEFFLSLEGPDGLLGFCRLRFPPRSLRPEFTPRTAIVRELHVYGQQKPLGEDGRAGEVQHRGFGKRLLAAAEAEARAAGKTKLLVISGVGVREYYAKLGYVREGPYMAKLL